MMVALVMAMMMAATAMAAAMEAEAVGVAMVATLGRKVVYSYGINLY